MTGKITDILPYGTKEADEDYGEKRILPGFIDVHTHGAYGFDTNDAEPEGLRDWMKRIPEEGGNSYPPHYGNADAGGPDRSVEKCCGRG